MAGLVQQGVGARRVEAVAGHLRGVEDAVGSKPNDELVRELDEIEGRVERISVPLSYTEELYSLRSHIQLVRRRLLMAPKETTTAA